MSKTRIQQLMLEKLRLEAELDKIKKELNYSFTNVEDYITTIIPYYKN